MQLQYHDRARAVGPIPGDITGLLTTRFIDDVPLDERSERRLQAFLGAMRDREQWICCDCRSDIEPPPLLSIRRTEGRLTLVRHGATMHSESCPLHRAQKRDEQADRPRRRRGNSPLLPYTGLLSILEPDTDLAGAGDREEHRRTRGHNRIPRLGRVFLTLAQRAGLDLIGPDDIRSLPNRPPFARDVSSQYGKLDCLAELPVSNEVTFGEVACTHFSACASFLARFRRLEDRFSDSRAQGWALFPVDRFELGRSRNRIFLDSRRGKLEADICGPLHVFGPAGVDGPFFFLGVVGKVIATGRYELLRGYLHPIYSKTLLLPVDSGLEREAASVLLGQLAYWRHRHGMSVRLEKPLFDTRIEDEWVRPDFRLVLPSGQAVIVEVLGYPDDPEYMARKEKICQLLGGTDEVADLVTWSSGQNLLRRATTAAVLSAEQAHSAA